MRLDFIEVCGFRGFREKVRIEFGGGFTVITGRNGVGKSTLCDAVEFAILGEIAKYTVERAASETIRDYVWWRGKGAAEAYYVTAGFMDEAGQAFSITRTREGSVDVTEEEIQRRLCFGPVPEDALRQLCKTSIIRDEWIAALSLDLTEVQRFELVRTALGSVDGPDFTAKSKAVLSAAESLLARSEEVYEGQRTMLTSMLAQLSQSAEAATRAADVSKAMTVLDRVVASTDGPLAQRLELARRQLPDRRHRLQAIGEAAFQARELEAEKQHQQNAATVSRRTALQSALRTAEQHAQAGKERIEQATMHLEALEDANGTVTSLAALVQHGETLGLHDDTCPLCAAVRTQAEFADGIARAKVRMEQLVAGVSAARSALDTARLDSEPAFRALAMAQLAWGEEQHAIDRLTWLEQRHLELLQHHQLELRFANDTLGLEREAERESNQLLDLEQALAALETSGAVSRLAVVESRVEAARKSVDDAAGQLARAQAAVASAKSLDKSVRRAGAEIIDERLALISPLLNELYQRLRPHADWRQIEYSIRGDVRRFLSLRVGDGLNPQFVFSSGQRRAAGLAFLLSVHLSRAWTSWKTLMLDDPVQHIDDFRALHLVEVLAAMRHDGRQIVCAVEDEALADLLCRRLLSVPGAEGRRISIDTSIEGAPGVVESQLIPPMPNGVLRRSIEQVEAS